MKYSLFLALILVSFMGIFSVTKAQSLGGQIIETEFIPSVPRANEEIYVYLKSYMINIDSAEITWIVNGKVIKSGRGLKNFNFMVGDSGRTTNLQVKIKSVEGQEVVQNYPLTPATVDLIWQSDGFVPPFYKGKSLFAHENNITIVAMPHITGSNGAEINRNNLVYKWKKNGSVVESAGGFGKNTLTVPGSVISRTLEITVEASSLDGSSGAIETIKLTPINPEILFYEKNPTLGIQFQKTLFDNVKLGSSEVSVVAMPFYFSSDDYLNQGLNYMWSINNTFIRNEPTQNSQVFRKAEGVSGTSKISLSVKNSDKILQYSTNSFNLTFQNEN